ncbi:unnamed protein product [Calypogeia fissa]
MAEHKYKECCTPGPPAKEHDIVGKEENWDGLDVYVNWPPGATKGVVLATDVFGWDRPLLRKLADKVAAEGFVTAVPDFFKGDPINPDIFPSGDEFQKWFAKHPVDSAVAETLAVIKVMKEKGIKSVGIAGFCYGGKVGTIIAKEGVVDAVVILHPGMVTNDEIKLVKTPFAILAAELDQTTTVAQVEEYKKILESQNEIDYFVKVFPGQKHGWTVRYDENDEKSFKPAHESHEDTINWFKKHLK